MCIIDTSVALSDNTDKLPTTSDQEGFPRDHTRLLGRRWDKLSSCVQSDLNGYIAVDDIIGRDRWRVFVVWGCENIREHLTALNPVLS